MARSQARSNGHPEPVPTVGAHRTGQGMVLGAFQDHTQYLVDTLAVPAHNARADS